MPSATAGTAAVPTVVGATMVATAAARVKVFVTAATFVAVVIDFPRCLPYSSLTDRIRLRPRLLLPLGTLRCLIGRLASLPNRSPLSELPTLFALLLVEGFGAGVARASERGSALPAAPYRHPL